MKTLPPLVGCLLLACPVAAADRPIAPREAEFFEKSVRPVLAEHCFTCHGPQKQKAGLRLDSAAALRKGGDSGPAIVPGSPEKSLLIQAVRHAGDLKMPPPPKPRLSTVAVEALTRWVKRGAPWPADDNSAAAAGAWKGHWAFQPIKAASPPRVSDPRWPRTAVDPFILAKLDAAGLTPSLAADRAALLRRVTFDLTGLPPTPEAVAAFEADPAPDAYERVVDRLLASPQYGERWGRYWLDVARYADTKGYVFFQEGEFPWAYTYRDYVIAAFNADLPYNRFITEQLAADLLPLGDDKRPLTALGFLTLGGRFMNNEQDILDDRIDVVTRGLLGLTVTCARCHDHKFDPIPTRDYYSLYGVFASCREPTVPPLFAEPARTPAYAAFEKELKARQQKLTDFVRAKHTELVTAARTRAADYFLAAHKARHHPRQDDFMLIADGADINPQMLIRWQSYLRRTRAAHHPVLALWHAFSELPEKEFADRAQRLCARLAAPDPARPLNHLVVKAFASSPPKTIEEAARRYGDVLNAADKAWQESAKRTPPPPALPDPSQEEVRLVFYGPDSPPNVAMNPLGDLALLPDRPSQAKLQEFRTAVEKWRSTGPGAPPRAMTLEDLPTPLVPRVFVRGNPNNPGPIVPRQFLGVLTGEDRKPFQSGSGRLELARAITDRNNPLTARVLVNRVWQHHFGTALVRTPSDFGLRSEPPTHAELLDHLAAAFMDGGWSVKKLHRLIVLSAAYRQLSDDRPAARRTDPENRLLWRTNRSRLDFEATRDALLAVSGRLTSPPGGPPMRGLTETSANRRTVYGLVDRLNLPGLFRTFDFPSPDATSPGRDATTVPPQALFLMNNPFVLEAAKRTLHRPDVASLTDPARRVDHLYRLFYGRGPTAEESALALDYLKEAAGGSVSTAAWERYVHGLFQTNEFVFVD